MEMKNFFTLTGALLLFILGTRMNAQDLEVELAKLEVELTILKNKLKRPLPSKSQQSPMPASTIPGAGQIGEAEFSKWPVGTKVETAKNNFVGLKSDEFKRWIATQSNQEIPAGTKIMAPGWQEVKLSAGQKSYELWKRSGFYILIPGPGLALTPGLQYLNASDIEEFPKGTQLVIRQTKKEERGPNPQDIRLGKDAKDLDFYLDEDERLLAVISAKAGDEEIKFVSIGSFPQFKRQISDFIGV